MPSVPFFKFRFTPSAAMFCIALLFFLFFVRLGFWQLHRAEEKQMLISAQQQQARKAPVIWSPAQKLPMAYERISVHGQFLPQIFLLDNQHYQHQFGYDVVSPLQLDEGTVLLVDRGWVPGDATRQTFPQIKTPLGMRQVEGSVYFPSKSQWVLGEVLEKKNPQLVIFERLDAHLASELLQKKVYPFIIRLDKGAQHGFVREWETVSMPPQRHLAYAVQWFALALVILILFVVLNLKKEK